MNQVRLEAAQFLGSIFGDGEHPSNSATAFLNANKLPGETLDSQESIRAILQRLVGDDCALPTFEPESCAYFRELRDRVVVEES